MARVALQQNSFAGGAISPRLYGRSDLAKYAASAEEIVNFIPRPEGGLMRRHGTRFLGDRAEIIAGVEGIQPQRIGRARRP